MLIGVLQQEKIGKEGREPHRKDRKREREREGETESERERERDMRDVPQRVLRVG